MLENCSEKGKTIAARGCTNTKKKMKVQWRLNWMIHCTFEIRKNFMPRSMFTLFIIMCVSIFPMSGNIFTILKILFESRLVRIKLKQLLAAEGFPRYMHHMWIVCFALLWDKIKTKCSKYNHTTKIEWIKSHEIQGFLSFDFFKKWNK